MHAAQPICILWDSSHIWGLMAWRAVRAMGLPCRLVKGKEIAQGALLGKPHRSRASAEGQQVAPADKNPEGRAALLLVPGGNARLKAAGLGEAGRDAVRQWMEAGGNYLGFCGGAGLALSHAAPQEGLGICPWSRAAYPERLHHLISGHTRVRLLKSDEFSFCPQERVESSTATAPASGTKYAPVPEKSSACPSQRQNQPQTDAPHAPSLPVWWPGRFAAEENPHVRVLVAYDAPDADFWLADLPLQSIPSHIFEQWQSLYGVNLSADFLKGQPLVVSGAYGKGRYVLSYSHLETPHSPDANLWLAQLLQQLTGLEPSRTDVPLWQLRHPCHAWPEGSRSASLLDALRHMRGLLDLAVEHHLFFGRTHWLWGWRTGLPGAACNNLHAALCTAASLAPSPAALAYWQEVEPHFSKLADLFAAGAEGYFLACRLAETLHPTLPDAVDKRGLDNQRQALFGHPMSGGGLMEELLDITEELIFLSQDATPCDLQ
ncbi:MAG: BPL-N domain-containing protein [Desulfovibrio sp.]|uniref:BPL-N domain-containing protein n=1 Tax=Desulfovibrio sp. TaxID=885 RepID=UPI0039E29548